MNVHRNAAVLKMLLRGDIGLAEAFMDGDWTTPDLHAVLDFGYENEKALAGSLQASSVFSALLRLRHRLQANTKRGSRRNIAYHYDLGNAFYRLWLDSTMTYSSALFAEPGMSLEDAQRAKYRRLVEQLDIGADDRVLEIGCGWGGFAEFTARETGCHVTGITLSKEQAAFARERIAAAELGDRVEIRIQDYRDVPEQYDKIVSIEMFEAVGQEHWPVYFRVLRDRLRAGGRAGLQIITLAEDRFEAYRDNIDFIRRYIFPGGMLPTEAHLSEETASAGLQLDGRFGFALSYAETLHRWYDTFVQKWSEIAAQGFDSRFFRMWSFYLCGCEASFRSGATDVVQFVLSRR